ncbi:hypothetical protein GGD54_006337, partial [Rhizobium tropici]|nr:hypothetical protein [Rhizobium tropici]MBB5596825.1 hypothetical protein [Rhizobium tropici]MBB6489570.1 hypothetical protein [Rhizobium lusitanum]MBB6495875.1 hypothetical protein [Rhizobium tropici]
MRTGRLRVNERTLDVLAAAAWAATSSSVAAISRVGAARFRAAPPLESDSKSVQRYPYLASRLVMRRMWAIMIHASA